MNNIIFSNGKIHKLNISDLNNVQKEVQNFIKEQREGYLLFSFPKTVCIKGSTTSDVDVSNSKANAVPVVKLFHEGGTIIASPSDVEIGIFTKGFKANDIMSEIIHDISEILSEKGFESEITGNDLLVEGKKVLGCGSRKFGEIVFGAMHISLENNTELINKICTKTCIKTPTGLKQYNLSTQNIIDLCQQIFTRYFK